MWLLGTKIRWQMLHHALHPYDPWDKDKVAATSCGWLSPCPTVEKTEGHPLRARECVVRHHGFRRWAQSHCYWECCFGVLCPAPLGFLRPSSFTSARLLLALVRLGWAWARLRHLASCVASHIPADFQPTLELRCHF